MRVDSAFFGLLLLLAAFSSAPAPIRAQGTLEAYRRAATVQDRLADLAVGVSGDPTWIGESNRFWYRVSVAGGNEFRLVEAATQERSPAFDHARMASGLSSATGEAYTAITLPFSTFDFTDDMGSIEADAEGSRWRCSLSDYACARIGEARGRFGQGGAFGGFGRGFGGRPDTVTAIVSPDSTREAFIQNYNVAVRPHRRGAPPRTPAQFGGGGPLPGASQEPEYTLLSFDGSEGDAYELRSIEWSPDSRKLVLTRVQ